jgi:hypothetical protein
MSDNIFQILFADDINVFIDGENLNNMKHFMIFRSNKRNCHFNTDLKLNSQIITRVESMPFLGVMINEHLTW